MKAIFALLVFALFLPTLCFASGKLTVKPEYHLHVGAVEPLVGLSVYEKISPVLAYTSWTGVLFRSDLPTSEKEYTSVQEVEYYWGPLSLGAGFTFRYSTQNQLSVWKQDHDLHVKLGLKLW